MVISMLSLTRRLRSMGSNHTEWTVIRGFLQLRPARRRINKGPNAFDMTGRFLPLLIRQIRLRALDGHISYRHKLSPRRR